MTTPRVYKCFAFISYSRKDIRFAERLQRYLEHWALRLFSWSEAASTT